MRIVSGKYKGMIVPIIKNATCRPTTGKLKEAIFSILSSGTIAELDGANVLDLFTGTGSLAFEALSRGANFVLGIDREASHIKVCKEFALKLNEQDNINFLVSDATNLPNAQKQYDIIIIDPPYFHNMADKTIISLHNKGWLNHDATLMIEVGRKEDVKIPEYYTLIDERIYGNTKLIILRYAGAN